MSCKRPVDADGVVGPCDCERHDVYQVCAFCKFYMPCRQAYGHKWTCEDCSGPEAWDDALWDAVHVERGMEPCWECGMWTAEFVMFDRLVCSRCRTKIDNDIIADEAR